MRTVKIIVKGRVQGVFFRANTRDIAKKLGLRGYAKNLPDGNVEVVAQGTEDKLKQILEYCKKGPKSAEVTDIEVEKMTEKEEFDDFEVRH